MDREPIEATATRTTFVYDSKTGKVVHVHQFIPFDPKGTISDGEMEEMALAQTHQAFDRKRLSVLHRGADLQLDPRYRYRVDVRTLKLLIDEAPTHPAQQGTLRPPSSAKPAQRTAKQRPRKRRSRAR